MVSPVGLGRSLLVVRAVPQRAEQVLGRVGNVGRAADQG